MLCCTYVMCRTDIIFFMNLWYPYFYLVQIILIMVLLKCEVDPCPDKIGLTCDHPLYQ